MGYISLAYTLKFQKNGQNGKHNILGEYSKESSEIEEYLKSKSWVNVKELT